MFQIHESIQNSCRHHPPLLNPPCAWLQTVFDDDEEEKSCELSEAVSPNSLVYISLAKLLKYSVLKIFVDKNKPPSMEDEAVDD